jgi:hypothetical protein
MVKNDTSWTPLYFFVERDVHKFINNSPSEKETGGQKMTDLQTTAEILTHLNHSVSTQP